MGKTQKCDMYKGIRKYKKGNQTLVLALMTLKLPLRNLNVIDLQV
jgi:uncharacterized protein YbgA (DUF1722 family)